MFKPQVKKYLPADSVEIFLEQYKQVIEEYLHTHDAESTLLQNARYNYNTHLQKRIQAENSKLHLQVIIYIAIIVVLALSVIVILLKYENKRRSLQLQQALVCGFMRNISQKYFARIFV